MGDADNADAFPDFQNVSYHSQTKLFASSLTFSLAQGVLRDVESVKDELDRLVEKVRSVKELCNSMNLDDDAEELSPMKDAQVGSLHSVPLGLV